MFLFLISHAQIYVLNDFLCHAIEDTDIWNWLH